MYRLIWPMRDDASMMAVSKDDAPPKEAEEMNGFRRCHSPLLQV